MHDLQLITIDDKTCITVNGKPITNVDADNICQGMIIHFAQKVFLPCKSYQQKMCMASCGSI